MHMADIVDAASALEELQRNQAIAAARAPAAPKSPVCLNCHEKLKKRFNFCDADCRNDWQARTNNRSAAPRIVDDD